MYMENLFMDCPKVDIKMYQNAREITEPVEGALVPGHLTLTYIFRVVLRNSMRATVEHHFKDLENLPPVTDTICQADDFFMIKISNCGHDLKPPGLRVEEDQHVNSEFQVCDNDSDSRLMIEGE